MLNLKAEVTYPTNLVLNLKNWSNGRGPYMLRDVMFAMAARLQAHIKEDKLSGQVLRVRSGALRRSIKYTITGTKEVATATVSANTPYAAIHEWGGQTRPHVIKAKNAEFLAFMGRDGKMVFRKFVNHPGSKIPMRSYMRTALREMEGTIRTQLIKAFLLSLKQ